MKKTTWLIILILTSTSVTAFNTNFFAIPPNDLCNDAIFMTCGDSVSGTTLEATNSDGPSGTCGTTAGSPGIWYAIDGTGENMTLSLCGSSFDTRIQVYEGGCDALTCIGGNDDFCGAQSEVNFNSDAFSTYYIYVYGFGTQVGDFSLSITCSPPTTPPSNDVCDLAIPISCGDTASGTTVGATLETAPIDDCGTDAGAPGVWFSIDGSNELVTASLCNSSFDTKIQVFEGGCDALTCITGNDDYCDFQSEISFLTDEFSTYYIYVYGYDGSSGDFNLEITCQVPPDPPTNDDCVNAINLIANADDSCTETTAATIFGATSSLEVNECLGTANDDVWFKFTAVSEHHVILLNNIVGDTEDLYHILYDSDDCNNLNPLYCSDTTESVANYLTIGNTYLIRVYSRDNEFLQNVNFDICVYSTLPPIYTSTDDYTVEELITDILIDSECSQISNISYSTGTNFGNSNGIGYFNSNGSYWPFESGLILSTGNVLQAQGPENETLSDGTFDWLGDSDLEDAIPALTPGSTTNASVLEFDFVPIIDEFRFNFIFAAEEYGIYQCDFTDAFAFLLTDFNGVTTNLAVVPGTADPISVLSVRDNAYNSDCSSVNPEYFDSYYGDGGINPNLSPIDFRGHTVSLTALATVVPNETYHIKLVIAEDTDPFFDSAVFIEAGSFEIGEIDLGDDVTMSSGNASCEGEDISINLGIDQPPNSTINWYYNGVLISDESGSALTINASGTYTAELVIGNALCVFTDDILVEFFPNPEVSFSSTSITKCANEDFTLEALVSNSSNPNMGSLTFEWSLDGNIVQMSSSSTYVLSATASEEGLFTVRVLDDNSGCYGMSEIQVGFYNNSNCIDIPQGLSPNNDGYNDCLELDHLDDRSDIDKAVVFNRYGTKVFELNNYINQWCGTDQDGDLLPVGTYFYIIHFKSAKEPITSWIYLNY